MGLRQTTVQFLYPLLERCLFVLNSILYLLDCGEALHRLVLVKLAVDFRLFLVGRRCRCPHSQNLHILAVFILRTIHMAEATLLILRWHRSQNRPRAVTVRRQMWTSIAVYTTVDAGRHKCNIIPIRRGN